MQRKLIVLMLIAGLMAINFAAPVEAKKKKKKKKAKPVATTLFLEGESNFGEQEMTNVPVARPGTYLKLQAKEGSGEKSMGIPSYSVGPNNKCAGNSLFPVFVGELSGTIKGDLKVSFGAQSTPGGKVDVRVWPDLAAQACNDEYPEPAGSVVVDLPTSKGIVEAVIEGVDFEASSELMIQLTGVAGSSGAPSVPPFYGRAYYGTKDAKVEFNCLPASGSSCIGG